MAQTLPHMPRVQTSSVLHIVPHAPQLVTSLCMSTHTPLQSVSPPEHEHELAEQFWLGSHIVPHMPQLFGSLRVSTQPPAHIIWPLVQPPVPPMHVPLEHVCVALHI
jgi:hypothetical protein